jgi:hypothetical protein
MAYSYHNPIGDGVTTQYALNFTLGYISKGDVHVWVQDEVDGLGVPIERSITWINDSLIDIGAAAPVGATVLIRRIVSKEALQHDYTNGAAVLEENLDQSNLQSLMLAHESFDGFNINPAVADRDMQGFRVVNVGAPEQPGDAVNKAYTDDILVQAQVAVDAAVDAEQAKIAAEAAAAAAEVSAAAALVSELAVGGQLQNVIHNISNIQYLRDYTGSATAVQVLGYYAEGDGGGGNFRWVSSDLSAAVTVDTQGGIYVAPSSAPTGASGAWVRHHSGAVNAEWFGAKGDGVEDDANEINSALLMAEAFGGAVVLTPGKAYGISSMITIPAGVTLCSLESNAQNYMAISTHPQLIALNAMPVMIDMSKRSGANNRAKTLRGVWIDGKRLADVGVDVANGIQVWIENNAFKDFTDGGAGIRGGGCLYLYINKNLFNGNYDFYSCDLLESYKIAGSADYYGVNVGTFDSNIVGGRLGLRFTGTWNVTNNDFEMQINGNAVIDINGSSSSYGIITGNYFECSHGASDTLINIEEYKGVISGNSLYGPGDSTIGSIGIDSSQNLYATSISGNFFAKLETGIKLGTGASSNDIASANTYRADVTYRVVFSTGIGGGVITSQTVMDDGLAIPTRLVQQDAGWVITGGVRQNVQLVYNLKSLNLKAANHFLLTNENSVPVTITTLTNANNGNAFKIEAQYDKAVTITHGSIFSLRKGTNYSLRKGYAVDFLVGYDGVAYEVGEESLFSEGTAEPSTGTYVVGNVHKNRAPASAGYIGWVCTVAGTSGVLGGANTTGNINTGSTSLYVANMFNLKVGQKVTIAGVTGTKTVAALYPQFGNRVDIDSASNATVSGAECAFTPAVPINGSITSGTDSLAVNVASDFSEGQYITVDGVSGVKQIISISGTTITIDSNADATVIEAAIAYSSPTFNPYGAIP